MTLSVVALNPAANGYRAVLQLAEQSGTDAVFDLSGLALAGRNGAVCPTADAVLPRRVAGNGVSQVAVFFPARDCFEAIASGAEIQLNGRIRVTRHGRADGAAFRLPT